jgi:hypothetical protein
VYSAFDQVCPFACVVVVAREYAPVCLSSVKCAAERHPQRRRPNPRSRSTRLIVSSKRPVLLAPIQHSAGDGERSERLVSLEEHIQRRVEENLWTVFRQVQSVQYVRRMTIGELL